MGSIFKSSAFPSLWEYDPIRGTWFHRIITRKKRSQYTYQNRIVIAAPAKHRAHLEHVKKTHPKSCICIYCWENNNPFPYQNVYAC